MFTTSSGIGERGRREADVKANVKADGWEGLD